MAAAETANEATNRATDVADRRHQRARIKILARSRGGGAQYFRAIEKVKRTHQSS